MKVQCQWKEKLRFEAIADGHPVIMDAKSPLGSDQGPTPKSLVLMAICGCTAMDVMALMRKYKQEVTSFLVEAFAEVGKTDPKVFTTVNLNYQMVGPVERDKFIEAVKLSQTKYCGVSAMISRVCPITYTITLNNEVIGQGQAKFSS